MIKFRRIRNVKIAVIFFSVFLMSYLIFSSNNSVYLNEEFASGHKSHDDSAERKVHGDEEMAAFPPPPEYERRHRIEERTIPEIPVTRDKKLPRLFSTNAPSPTASNLSSSISTPQIFSPNITKSRLDTLFGILSEKEEKYGDILDQLNLISFKALAKSKSSRGQQPSDGRFAAKYKYELDNYLDVDPTSGERIVSSEKFVDHLWQKSMHYSFTDRRVNVAKSAINDTDKRPVIVTAANMHYYEPLQATVYHIHRLFPDYKLIVYDLGLTSDMLASTKRNCKCEVKSYDPQGIYQTKSPHVSDLKTYAWKPLIVAETLKDHDTVLYVDSSIRFLNNQIEPIVDACRNVSMLTQFIGLKLTCYTNPKMFDWFHESVKSFENSFTIEANILMFHKSFLTSLIMKAWVTCALDKNCIAPIGSTISGCCGCHRFDQDGLTIINSYFFGQPTDQKFLPAYSFTTQESYFFEIRRYAGMKYFS